MGHNDAVLVHDYDGTAARAPLFVPQAVGLDHLPVGMEVGEQGIGYVPKAG